MNLHTVRALAHKELEQHRMALVGLTIAVGAMFVLGWAWSARETTQISLLALVPHLLGLGLTPVALVLGHRLVVGEYYGRTQRFLEALPIRRAEEALVKALFGLAWLLGWGLMLLSATIVLALAQEPFDLRFLAILIARLSGFVFAQWSLVFLFSVFGRLRLPLLLTVGLISVVISRNSDVSLVNWGPLALISQQTFSVERLNFPVPALGWSAGIGLFSLALALALLRLREGSIIERLAKPVSLREKAAFLVVALGGLVGLLVADEKKILPMPGVTSEKVLQASGLEVVYMADPLRAPAQELVTALTPRLAELGQILPGAALRLRLVHGEDVLRERPQPASRHPGEGLVIRVNLHAFVAGAASPEHRFERALATIIHEVIATAAGVRVMSEPRHWLLDGLSLYLATGAMPADGPAAPAGAAQGGPPAEDFVLDAALVAVATSDPAAPAPGAASLAGYHDFAERVGEFPASALGASGWRLLAQHAGGGRVRALARAAFARRGTDDVRDFLHHQRWPPARLFGEATGIPWSDFLALWTRWLQGHAARPMSAARLARLPRAKIDLATSSAGIDPLSIRGRVRPALPPPAECSVSHRLEQRFDTTESPELLDEEHLALAPGGAGFAQAIEGDYESGERVFVAVDCQTADAPWGLRLFSGRVTVP